MELATRAGIPVKVRGALSLVPSNGAAAFLDICESAEVRVLGFEGFELVGNGVRPDMDAIADLSAVESPKLSVQEARGIAKAIAREGLYLDFVLEPAS